LELVKYQTKKFKFQLIKFFSDSGWMLDSMTARPSHSFPDAKVFSSQTVFFCSLFLKYYLIAITGGDRMFLGMQDFVFSQI